MGETFYFAAALVTLLTQLEFLALDAVRMKSAEIKKSAETLHDITEKIVASDKNPRVQIELSEKFNKELKALELKINAMRWPGILFFDYEEIKKKWDIVSESLPKRPEGIELIATAATVVKSEPKPATELPEHLKCKINANDRIFVVKFPTKSEGDHFKVTLSKSIDDCAFGKNGQIVYLFSKHWKGSK